MPERRSVSVGVEVVAERRVEPVEQHEIARRFAVEAPQVAEHGPETRAKQIALLGKKARKVVAGIFDLAVRKRNGKRHVGQLRRYSQMGEQSRQIRIGQLVVDNKTGIDRYRSLRARTITVLEWPPMRGSHS